MGRRSRRRCSSATTRRSGRRIGLLWIPTSSISPSRTRIAKDPRFQRLACTHKGTYADDCIVDRITQASSNRCNFLAISDAAMSSSHPSFSQFGVDAMNGYFMASSSGMLGTEVPPYHPSMPAPDHGGYGLGEAAAGGATVAADIGAQFAANNLMLASLASQLFAPTPALRSDHLGARTPQEEEMNGGYGMGGGDSPRQSDAHAVALWASSKKPYCDWGNAGGPRTVSVDGSYQLAGPLEAAGFYYRHPLAAGHSTETPSELSLSLCSKSSPDSMSNATDQFSPEASRSCLTHIRRAQYELPQHQVHCPQARFRPVHFAVVVARSPYAPVAQQVLNDVVGRVLHGVADDSGSGVDSGTGLPSSCSAGAASAVSSSNQLMASPEEHPHGGGDAGARWGEEAQRVRSELLKMLQLMDQKYNQCLDEIQSTTAKFNSVMLSGSGRGSICAPFAHRAVSATYSALRRRITGEITVAASRPSRPAESSVIAGGERDRSWESALIQKHLAAQQLRRREQQCWRPQRGLPEKSIAVLKAWMFENFVHPYPMDSEKDMLAARSGLSRSQVANWFINARVRLWKPLIEELHEELKRSSGEGVRGAAMEQLSSQYVVG